jgi:hypothetical protein
MTEQAETIRYLTEEEGMPEDLARLVLRDDDLWILDPSARVAWEPGEEDVKQWEAAYEFAYALADGFGVESRAVNEATGHILSDLRARTEEALRRARLRQERAARA